MDIKDILEKIHYNEILATRNSVFLIDIDFPQGITELDDVERSYILETEYYLSYSIHELNGSGSGFVYKILYRVVDENNNLIIFAKQSPIDIER